MKYTWHDDAAILHGKAQNLPWKKVAGAQGRTVGQVRNRYIRMTDTREKVNKCSQCGQFKRGHTCVQVHVKLCLKGVDYQSRSPQQCTKPRINKQASHAMHEPTNKVLCQESGVLQLSFGNESLWDRCGEQTLAHGPSRRTFMHMDNSVSAETIDYADPDALTKIIAKHDQLHSATQIFESLCDFVQ